MLVTGASDGQLQTRGWVQGGGYSANFLRSVIFTIFPNYQNSGYLCDITFIFVRCHRSWAAETPGKYEHIWNYLTYTFAKSKFSVTEKLANGALVTPTPIWVRGWGLRELMNKNQLLVGIFFNCIVCWQIMEIRIHDCSRSCCIVSQGGKHPISFRLSL